MGGELIRALSREQPVPQFDGTPCTIPPPLAEARVAIVTTAALRRPDQRRFELLDQHSPNFDRSGWLADVNVVFPVDRLTEMAAEGRIGSVAQRHISFVGAQEETLTTMRLDSGPAAPSCCAGTASTSPSSPE